MAVVAEVTVRRLLRLRPVHNPAQEAEGALAQDPAPEQSRAEDRHYDHQLDDEEGLTKDWVEPPDADGGSQRGGADTNRPPGHTFSYGCRQGTLYSCWPAGPSSVMIGIPLTLPCRNPPIACATEQSWSAKNCSFSPKKTIKV